MNLTPYLDTVRDGLENAAALADDSTQQVAARLAAPLETSTRLALISALSDAASTISAELAPASVELRIVGQDPEFVVSVPTSQGEPTVLRPDEESATAEEADGGDEPLARVSLRLPASVKAKVDDLAAQDGISTNAWLLRAVTDALADRRRDEEWPTPPEPPRPPFVGGLFGPHGPFGPHGVFGPGGVFGPAGIFGGGRATPPHGPHHPEPGSERFDHEAGPRRPGGSVRGWAR